MVIAHVYPTNGDSGMPDEIVYAHSELAIQLIVEQLDYMAYDIVEPIALAEFKSLFTKEWN